MRNLTAACGEAGERDRRAMSDDTLSGGLPDLRGLSLSDLRDKIGGTTIATALDMILSDQDPANHGFNNYM
jgi:hypothetical protein